MKSIFQIVVLLLFPYTIVAQSDFWKKVEHYIAQDKMPEADALVELELQHVMSPFKRLKLFSLRAYISAENHDITKAEEILSQLKTNKEKELFIREAKALIYYRKRDFWKSIQWTEKCIDKYMELDKPERIARFLLLQGLNFRHLSDYSQCEVFFKKAEKFYKKAKHPLGQATIERYRGRMLTLLDKEKRQQGKILLKSSANKLKRIEAYAELGYAYTCLVDAYLMDKQWDLALYFQDSAYIAAARSKDPNLIAFALNNYGEILLGKKDGIKAEIYFNQAVNTYAPDNKGDILFAQHNLYKAQYLSRYPKVAVQNMKDLLTRAEKDGGIFLQKYILDWLLSTAHDNLNAKEELCYTRKIMTVKDSIFSKENRELMLKQEVVHKYQELQHQVQLQRNKVERRMARVVVLIAVTTTAFLIISFVYFRKNMRRKLKVSQLEKENEEQKRILLDHQQAKLLEEKRRMIAEKALAQEQAERQQKIYTKIVQAKKEERSRISRHLHDKTTMSVHQIRQLLDEITKSKVFKLEQINQAEEMLQYVQKDIQRISRELSPEKFEKNTLEHHFKNLFPEREKIYKIKHILFVDERAEEYLFTKPFLKNMLFEAVLTAINNIVKHAQATELSVNIFYLDGIFVTIEDNGIGFNPSTVKYGYGFEIMKGSAEFFGGKFDVDSSLGGGTVISITIPQVKLLEESF